MGILAITATLEGAGTPAFAAAWAGAGALTIVATFAGAGAFVFAATLAGMGAKVFATAKPMAYAEVDDKDNNLSWDCLLVQWVDVPCAYPRITVI